MPETSIPPHPEAVEAAGRYWLVVGLPWPDESVRVAQAAYAVPAPFPAAGTAEIAAVFTLAQAYTQRHPHEPVVWFADLTRWLDRLGLDWAGLGVVDWQRALDALPHMGLPGVSLSIDRRAHLVLCDASRHGMTLWHPAHRSERVTEQERGRLRSRMFEVLRGLSPESQPGSAASGGNPRR